MAGAGLLFRNVGPETKALGFSNAINFPALWTCGQDDELVIDNQGFWFRRRCEEVPEYRAIELLNQRKTKTESAARMRDKLIGNAALQ